MKSSKRRPANEPERLAAFRSPGPCLSDNEVEDFILDRLSNQAREAIEEHLLACAACVEKVEAEEEFVIAAREASRILVAEEARGAEEERSVGRVRSSLAGRLQALWSQPWGWGPRFALAGSVAVIVLALVLPMQWRQEGYSQITLVTQRSDANAMATASARKRISLQIDLTELRTLPVYSLELVDVAGSPVRRTTLKPSGQSLDWRVDRLSPGQYWIRLADGRSGELLREFGLVVTAE